MITRESPLAITGTHRHTPPVHRLEKRLLWSVGAVLVAAGALAVEPAPAAARDAPATVAPAFDKNIADLIAAVSDAQIREAAVALQDLGSRAWGQPGNARAAAYIHGRLSGMPSLTVAYQDGALSNVVATLKGTDPAAAGVFIVGAHYDSVSPVITNAPGATDNAAGVASVLEYARVLGRRRFKHTILFAFWNREETGLLGSRSFVERAKRTQMPIGLYLNNDSIAFDPGNRFVLDILFNRQAEPFRNMLAEHIAAYGIGFARLTDNLHKCGGDHSPFWANGFPALSTHQEEHGAHYHGTDDTADKINLRYARLNMQAGMSVLARLAGLQP